MKSLATRPSPTLAAKQTLFLQPPQADFCPRFPLNLYFHCGRNCMLCTATSMLPFATPESRPGLGCAHFRCSRYADRSLGRGLTTAGGVFALLIIAEGLHRSLLASSVKLRHRCSAAASCQRRLHLLRAHLCLERVPLQRQLFGVQEIRVHTERHSVRYRHARYGLRR